MEQSKLTLLTKITHPIIFPLVTFGIIPTIWFAQISNTTNPSSINWSLGIIDAIMISVQILSYWTVFISRKGDAKVMNNALVSKYFTKIIMLFSGSMLIFLFIISYVAFGIVVNEHNVHTLDQNRKPTFVLNSINWISWVFFASFFSLLFIVMDPRYNYGQSYALFKTIELKNFSKIFKASNFQKGFYLYDAHLANFIGMRIKHLDKIKSSILVNSSESMEDGIQQLTKKFTNDWLEPARYLCETANIPKDEFFQSKSRYEDLERWSKVISYIIPLIGLGLEIYFQNIHQKLTQ